MNLLQRLTSKFVITLVIANTSTLILPLNAALAETSESSGPFTNINMSLFFAIALVGATVGGKKKNSGAVSFVITL